MKRCTRCREMKPLDLNEGADTWARDKVKDLTKPRPMDPEREDAGVPAWPLTV